MRTVSFSSEPVRRLIDEAFVCSVENSKGQASTGASFSHAPRDPAGPCLRGNGQQNVQLYFATPEGELFHVLSGFVGPEDLQRELEFALRSHWAIANQESRQERKEALIAVHREFLKQQGHTDAEIDAAGDGFASLRDLTAGFDPRDFQPERLAELAQPDAVFAKFAKVQTLSDHRFAMEHPLLPVSEFRPEMLVGSGQSFFGSTSSGGPRQR
jgi:hypothetical protein